MAWLATGDVVAAWGAPVSSPGALRRGRDFLPRGGPRAWASRQESQGINRKGRRLTWLVRASSTPPSKALKKMRTYEPRVPIGGCACSRSSWRILNILFRWGGGRFFGLVGWYSSWPWGMEMLWLLAFLTHSKTEKKRALCHVSFRSCLLFYLFENRFRGCS